MEVNGSVELVNADDGFYVVIGKPGDGYELYRARLDHVGHHTRKWQAVAAAKGDKS